MNSMPETLELYCQEIKQQYPDIVIMGEAIEGGQKNVFPCKYHGQKIALKLVKIMCNGGYECLDDSAEERVMRELNIMKKVDSEYFVKPIDMPLKKFCIGNDYVLAYAEEWIEGISVRKMFDKKDYDI